MATSDLNGLMSYNGVKVIITILANHILILKIIPQVIPLSTDKHQ